MKSKFNAFRCESNGIKFPSKLERNYYERLVLLQKCGEISFFLRQPSFDLPGGVKYLADFLVFYPDGRFEFIDTKGADTPISKMKRKQVEDLFPVKITIIRKV